MKAQPKLALLPAAAAQAGTQAPSAQPWSGLQVSSTWPISSTIVWRSALHSFMTGGGSPVVPVLASVVVVSVVVPAVVVVSSAVVAAPVSLIDAGCVVSPVSPAVVLLVGGSPVPVMPELVGSLAWVAPPVGSPVVAPVEGPPPVVVAASVPLALVPPPQAPRSRHHVVHCIPYP
jgi:hypothetical protein